MFFEESVQAGRTDFFLAFEDEFHVVAEQAFAHHVFECFYLNHGLPLVIVRAACPDASVTDFRFEWLAVPKFQRFGGHHVVVGVDQYGRCVRVNAFFGIH